MLDVRRTPILMIVLASYLMLVLDISIVITALPKMRQALGFSTAGLAWVENAYTLAFGGLLLLGARAGDIFGRRRIFILGIALFAASSLACGLAPSAAWLIAARAVQGVGAAIAAPSTLALLTATFPQGRERTRALAYYGAVAGGGTTLGLILGGVLTDWISWRAGLFINVPIGATLIVAARRYVAETARHSGRFDLSGAATATLGMTALVFGIVRSTSSGWSDRLTVAARSWPGSPSYRWPSRPFSPASRSRASCIAWATLACSRRASRLRSSAWPGSAASPSTPHTSPASPCP
ncbi:MAG: hypothetical protein QOI02_1739 [Actinomycetota bacterium]|jgi:MFS family permease|nr:hypothetical protein [Actinomycetota bacterium]